MFAVPCSTLVINILILVHHQEMFIMISTSFYIMYVTEFNQCTGLLPLCTPTLHDSIYYKVYAH